MTGEAIDNSGAIKKLRREAREKSKREFQRIYDELNETPAPAVDEANVNRLLASIRSVPERIQKVRALLTAILCDSNPWHLKAEWLENLRECSGWPSIAQKSLRAQTIRNFTETLKTRRDPQNASILASYLFALSVLRRGAHPCFQYPVADVLAHGCEPLMSFELAISIPTNPGTALAHNEVVAMGREFNRLMARGSNRANAADLSYILRAPLFRDMKPARTDADLLNPEFQRDITAIRLGISGGTYVASKLSASLVPIEIPDAQPETYLYARTWMAQGKSLPRIHSHGFLMSRIPDTYLAQYHLEGHGLNIAAISPGELRDESRPFVRGIILATDREGNKGALASRIVFLRTKWPDLILRSYSRDELVGLLAQDRPDVDPAEIFEYLRSVGETSLQPLPLTPDGGKAEISTWRELLSYLERDDVQARIQSLDTHDDRLRGYLHGPVRA